MHDKLRRRRRGFGRGYRARLDSCTVGCDLAVFLLLQGALAGEQILPLRQELLHVVSRLLLLAAARLLGGGVLPHNLLRQLVQRLALVNGGLLGASHRLQALVHLQLQLLAPADGCSAATGLRLGRRCLSAKAVLRQLGVDRRAVFASGAELLAHASNSHSSKWI